MNVLRFQKHNEEKTAALAIILHKHHCSNSVSLSRHPIIHDPEMRIGSGAYLSKEAKVNLINMLSDDESNNNGLLPHNVLSLNPLVWFTPRQTRKLWFRVGDRTKGYSVPLPRLLFVDFEKTVKVYAVKTNSRPCETTQLYRAPLMNVYADGRLCMGSNTPPESNGLDRMAEWESIMFESLFTHENNGQSIQSAGGNSNHVKFYRDLVGESRFPNKELIPMRRTLGAVL